SRRIVTHSAEEPEISLLVHPAHRRISRSRDVVRICRPLRSIGSYLIHQVRSAHPRPFTRAVVPQIVEIIRRPGRIVTMPAEEPEITVGIPPTDAPVSRPRNVGGIGDPQTSVDSRLVVGLWSIHPRPLVDVRAGNKDSCDVHTGCSSSAGHRAILRWVGRL